MWYLCGTIIKQIVMEKNYRQQVWDLRKEIENSIANIVSNKGNRINIPFYYDEDVIDDDIETLIEDEYDVRAENGVNLYVEVINHSGYIQQIYVVAVCKNSRGEVELVSKDSNIHYLTDVARMVDLVEIYERIAD
jgi:hypothetical protein